MIKSLEIKNFESHKHTVLKDFSPGFNLICGRSNQGKTSILRALKAVCFNEFNPRSIRVGEKFCEITLVTDKGKVYVKKGPKDNHWETTKNGETTKEWDKVGKGLPDDVAEITGMRTVNLGGIEFNANFMDQLSAHFMLASIDDQKASPSDRVRIIDAVSGLTGVEELVKNVSLHNRNKMKEIGSFENEINALKVRKHQEIFLEKEKNDLAVIEGDFVELRKAAEEAILAKRLLDDFVLRGQEVASAKTALSALPKTDEVEGLLKSCEEDFKDFREGEKLKNEIDSLSKGFKESNERLNSLPNVNEVSKELATIAMELEAEEGCQKLLKEIVDVKKWLQGREERLKSLPDVEVPEMMIRKMESMNVVIADAERIAQWMKKCQGEIKQGQEGLEKAKAEEEELEKELHGLLDGMEVCPLCGQRIESKEKR